MPPDSLGCVIQQDLFSPLAMLCCTVSPTSFDGREVETIFL
jgi:hypothetical protein